MLAMMGSVMMAARFFAVSFQDSFERCDVIPRGEHDVVED